jgi:hypothetical protein
MGQGTITNKAYLSEWQRMTASELTANFKAIFAQYLKVPRNHR